MTNLETIVINVATQLLTGGSTTTLDIKNQCRLLHPGVKIYQSDVSDIMDTIALAEITNLTYDDNGTVTALCQ